MSKIIYHNFRSKVGKYGIIIKYNEDFAGPGIGSSVYITEETEETYTVRWYVNSNQPLFSEVRKNIVDVY